MSNQDATSIAKEWLEAFNRADWQRTKDYLAPNSIYDEHGTQRHIQGSEAIIATYQSWKAAMPDVQGKVINTYQSGDKVALELTWEGTHTGPLETPSGTIPASGKSQKTPGVMTLEVSNGKIQKSSNYFDMLSFLQQIGAAPA
jgi:steroid delta-isomerase-like uncharacterized protein